MRQFQTVPEKRLLMILTCPSCGTRYQTDGARFAAPGRNVRCAKCTHVWFQAPPDAELEPEPEPVIAPEPEPEPAISAPSPSRSHEFISSQSAYGADTYAAPPERSRHRRGSAVPVGAIAGWASLTLVVSALSFGILQYRQTIAELWPQSASFYSAIGLHVNTRGLAFEDVVFEQTTEDGLNVLAVQGRIVNITDREIPLPPVRVALTDAESHELYHWTFDVGVPTLEGGGQNSFITRLSSPPAQARRLGVRFAETGETP